MQLPRLELTNTNALLETQQRRATIEIRQPMAEMKMKQPQPELDMRKSGGKLEIDQTEAFAEANLKHPFRLINEWAEKAKQKVIQTISKEAIEGDRLMKIEGQSKSVIPEIAKQNSEPPPKEITLGYLPKTAESIKFYYQPSEIKVKVKSEDLKIDVQTHSPIIKFNRGDLQIYLKQKASLHIQAVGASLDQKI